MLKGAQNHREISIQILSWGRKFHAEKEFISWIAADTLFFKCQQKKTEKRFFSSHFRHHIVLLTLFFTRFFLKMCGTSTSEQLAIRRSICVYFCLNVFLEYCILFLPSCSVFSSVFILKKIWKRKYNNRIIIIIISSVLYWK